MSFIEEIRAITDKINADTEKKVAAEWERIKTQILYSANNNCGAEYTIIKSSEISIENYKRLKDEGFYVEGQDYDNVGEPSMFRIDWSKREEE